MTVTLLYPPGSGLRVNATSGPLAAGKVNVYDPGTTTRKNSYPTNSDAVAGTNANANPVVLDANGWAEIWIEGTAKIVVTNSAGTTIDTVDVIGIATGSEQYDKDYVQGFTLSLDTDTAHDVNVTIGEARDLADSHDIILTGEITKRIDASWVVGDDQGGIDTGAVTTTAIYYVWVIKRTDTGVEDVLFSLSATGPTMPTSYDKKRLIGVLKTDGSSNISMLSPAGRRDASNSIWPDSATTDTYAIAPQPVHSAYFEGMRVRFKAATLNTVAATLNVNGLGAKALEYNGDALVTGDIIANQIVEAEYNGTAFQMITPPNILDVAQGGTGGASLTDGGVLLGSGTGAITAFGVLSDSNFLVGDGTTDPVAESGDTARISLGVGTSDSPTFTGLTTTGHTQRSLATGITAGSTQTIAGATALTKDINIVTVIGSDDDGVALPTAVAGKEVTIVNSDAAQRLQIWPGNGFSDTIDGGSANAVDANTLAAGASRVYAADGSTNWVTKKLGLNTPVSVASGGTGATSLTDGGVLLGSGTGAVTAMAVLTDGQMIVGDGTADPVAESGTTLRTSIGLGTGDSPTFTGLTTTGLTQRSLATSLTAGTTQTMVGALALTNDINIVTVVGNDNDGVALPTAAAGKEVQIINADAAQKLQVWPGNGFSDTIEGGSANAADPTPLLAGASRTYVADGATNWIRERTNNTARALLGTNGFSFVHLQRTATNSVTGDATAYTVVWDNEIVDKLGDWSSTTFTCRTTGYHKISCNLYVYHMVNANTNVACEIDGNSRDYLVWTTTRDFRDDDGEMVEFSTNILMTAADSFTMFVKVQGETSGTKSVHVDGGVKYARMSIEYIGA